MAQNKIMGFGPAFIANAAANILNGAVTSLAGPVGLTLGQPILYLRRIRIVNKTNAAITVSLFIGATGASATGTEFMGGTLTIPAFSYVDWVGFKALTSTQFLTGVCSAASAAVIEGDVEVQFS